VSTTNPRRRSAVVPDTDPFHGEIWWPNSKKMPIATRRPAVAAVAENGAAPGSAAAKSSM